MSKHNRERRRAGVEKILDQHSRRFDLAAKTVGSWGDRPTPKEMRSWLVKIDAEIARIRREEEQATAAANAKAHQERYPTAPSYRTHIATYEGPKAGRVKLKPLGSGGWGLLGDTGVFAAVLALRSRLLAKRLSA